MTWPPSVFFNLQQIILWHVLSLGGYELVVYFTYSLHIKPTTGSFLHSTNVCKLSFQFKFDCKKDWIKSECCTVRNLHLMRPLIQIKMLCATENDKFWYVKNKLWNTAVPTKYSRVESQLACFTAKYLQKNR